ncbi:hypothetical protein BJP40_25230 [Streptomyces sp. CC53]|uniref:hypothetical protein n=1 Tax=unclassified Streptomyces TaxID=2593676 RepID=UPI0008DCE9C1|nr:MULTISPECIES: hypothetical protein [unclassified Streptomyces]OII63302.1 hypothetical protein BJP40_25230 [Streptomyces sp. CC53]OII68094.1 hypothetical protein BJP39_22525 [Streptomyces sp. CC77]
MRMMLRATMDTALANEQVRSGQVESMLRQMMEQLQPEAAYFVAEEGRRAAVVVFDMQDPSQVPVVCEPLFLTVGAEVTLQPCMDMEDLRRGLAVLAGRP